MPNFPGLPVLNDPISVVRPHNRSLVTVYISYVYMNVCFILFNYNVQCKMYMNIVIQCLIGARSQS